MLIDSSSPVHLHNIRGTSSQDGFGRRKEGKNFIRDRVEGSYRVLVSRWFPGSLRGTEAAVAWVFMQLSIDRKSVV